MEREIKPVKINQRVAILIDGNNVELSVHTMMRKRNAMINFDQFIPKLLADRALTQLVYFREGTTISDRLTDRFQKHFHGTVFPCYKSADIPLALKAAQLAQKVDAIIIVSGDSDYIELVRYLKTLGIRVEVAGVPHSTANIIKKEADAFTSITASDCFVFQSTSLQLD